MSNPDINTLQHWFTSILVGHGRLPQKIAHAEKQWDLTADSLVKGDQNVSMETRIGVYATGYMLRLLECMQADLPALYLFLGEELFDLFGRAYILEQPSQSYTLYQLTAGFADFLDRTRPPIDATNQDQAAQYDLPAEIVRMERARLAVILSKGTEMSVQKSSLGFFAFFSGMDSSFEAHPALQLLVQKMPVMEFYRKTMQGEQAEIPNYQTTYLAATRIQYKIQFHEIIHWQYLFLNYLQLNGQISNLNDVVHEISNETSIDKSNLLSELCLWLPNAIEMGLLIEVE